MLYERWRQALRHRLVRGWWHEQEEPKGSGPRLRAALGETAGAESTASWLARVVALMRTN
jgi:hypothetical protein